MALLSFRYKNESINKALFSVFSLDCQVRRKITFLLLQTAASDQIFRVKFVSTSPCFGCRWSQTYEEGGHYSIWIQMPTASTNPICFFSVDKSPNNAYLRKY